jgi:hypothetical protein
VGVAVGVGVGVGVSVGDGVTVGVGVFVGVLVGEGVIEGVSDGVRVGTSTSTGTSLAMACTVPIARAGRKPSRLWSRRGPTSMTNATTTTNPTAISTGRSQSCLSGSPQCGQTSRPRLLVLPQYRQRTRRGLRWGLPHCGQTSCPSRISVRQRLHFFNELPRRLPQAGVRKSCSSPPLAQDSPDPAR